MAIEDTPEHERRRGERLFVTEPEPQIAVETREAFVASGRADPIRCRVQEQWDIEVDARGVEGVEFGRVERPTEVGAHVRGEQPELSCRARQLRDREVGILHRELREAGQTVRCASDEVRKLVVVAPAERIGPLGFDVREVRQRIRRQHLEIDAKVTIAARRRSRSMNGLPR